ncbi:MAG: pilus assembly protein [Candidatus Thiodiazotropha sp. (ex Ctena orbiculata)]|uniref:Pilus assembly protein n=1 Tax=Candidatus Thiodiazotropha taylori TaxID=2792791 RepID=A0A944MC69_9GAMM|nr:pilus assembly protein [Candidatus Thiodiazotropha taylori]PUB84769.1 MAG: pilus assembly protein [gamma proteobacterium symbiont of Ctena orbiculata]MBT2990009.1 pilus assembly protein [Candidatus Thiodiazotropha taylori]MBT2998268.1 pilus assembly protein [Candidatus Thiodiazotropha taylori]MBT3002621.1 pilus assembly protein [Candidatus Thiodiazotropha taylori]
MFSKTGKSSSKKHFGQGMTEYIIIVAVIAVAAIGAFGYFGQIVETQIAGVGQELGGADAEATRTAAGTLGSTAATTAASAENSMTNYYDNNSGE